MSEQVGPHLSLNTPAFGTASVRQAATAEEAAALVGAIEHFLAEQLASVPAPVAETGPTGWLRAALHEGVGSRDDNAIWS